MRHLGGALAVLLFLGVPAVPQTAKGKKTTSSSTATKSKQKRNSAARRRIPKPPPVSAAQRAEAKESVQARFSGPHELGIQNAGALVPFYELLHRQKPGTGAPLRVLHFGDSHTASDDWAAALRSKFQSRFGEGGSGFIHAGRPYSGFRRYDAKASATRGWRPSGLTNRETDGMHGLAGVSLIAERAGEEITLEADGSLVELFYLQQPGGGGVLISDSGMELARVSTNGETRAGYWRAELPSGLHQLSLRTLSSAPVRLFGWVVEKPGGVTWETLGINGAQADLMLGWNEELLQSHIEHRNPALIVLAYGTNEAARSDWTYETYRAAFREVLSRLRRAAPTASFLVVGPPDRMARSRGRWIAYSGLDRISDAQRDACFEAGAAFWNLRAGMGGAASMRTWVNAGLAQGDFVHFTSAGYRLIGESLFELMMGHFEIFQTVRRQLIGNIDNGQKTTAR